VLDDETAVADRVPVEPASSRVEGEPADDGRLDAGTA
jgi:hypothetical protein